MVNVGSPAPEFSLKDQSGNVHTLRQYRGRKVVLYFYPKDDTPSCTQEACDFRDALPAFAGRGGTQPGVVVLGVSPDDTKSHAKFAGKFGLGFPLLSDVPGSSGTPPVCDAYGVWGEKSMYGKTYMGVLRTTFLIDEKGVVAQRWDSVRVKGHAAEVLAAAGGEVKGNASPTAGGAGLLVEPKPAKRGRVSAKPAKKQAGKKPTARTKTPALSKAGAKGAAKKKVAGRTAKKASRARG